MSPDQKSSKPSSLRSNPSASSGHSSRLRHTEEETPLLSNEARNHDYGNAPNHDETNSPAASSLRSLFSGDSGKGKKLRRWPSIVALTILGIAIIVILCLGFAAPAAVEEYAKEAMVFEPTNLSIDSFTKTGVRARIQGDFRLDSTKVGKKSVRDFGRAGTWIAKAVESKRSKVKVYLPEYDELLIGTADVPPIKVDVRDGHVTHINILSDLAAGDLEGIRHMAMDWIEGRIGRLSVRGVADIPLKSGIFNLGTQSLMHTIEFTGEP